MAVGSYARGVWIKRWPVPEVESRLVWGNRRQRIVEMRRKMLYCCIRERDTGGPSPEENHS